MNWLTKLEKGSNVFYVDARNPSERVCSLSKVERFTKTQIVLKNCPTKFRRETGRAAGDWGFQIAPWLEEATPEAMYEHGQKLIRKRLIKQLNKAGLSGSAIDNADIPSLERMLEVAMDNVVLDSNHNIKQLAFDF